jgi:4-hydroxyacetophenone monooxygenase
MLLDNGWYSTLLKPNVTLIDSGVSSVSGNTVVSADGDAHEVDVLIVATGYDVARFLSPVEVIGRKGITIREAWDDDDSRAYLGTVVPEFPNFFMLYGPNTALGHGGSFIFTVECQIDFILSFLRLMAAQGLEEIECRPEVYESYNDTIQRMHSDMIWSHPGMSTYFRNARGRIVTNSPWRLIDFWKMTRRVDVEDFDTVPDVTGGHHHERPDMPPPSHYERSTEREFHFVPGSTSA